MADRTNLTQQEESHLMAEQLRKLANELDAGVYEWWQWSQDADVENGDPVEDPHGNLWETWHYNGNYALTFEYRRRATQETANDAR